MAEVNVSLDTFEEEVIDCDIPVIVDFWATWCGPCRMLAPVLEEIADEYDGKIKVCKVNVDDEPQLADQFGISSIPTVLVFKNGQLTATSVGYKEKDAILGLLK
mgnify:FL=1